MGGPTLRILLSEGSSTSAREAVTILGLAGHHVEICDPDRHCISRFSRFVRRFHRCPGLRTDPEGYVSFVLDMVSRERFDVLLPIHEQGLALARIRDALARHVAVALPTHEAYERVLGKAGFAGLLSELGLPHPHTRFVGTPQEAAAVDAFPIVLKSAIGTASRGVCIVEHAADLQPAIDRLEQDRAFDDVVLVQEYVDAPLEHAQAVFRHGELLGINAYRQIARGAGGGDAVKESVQRPVVRDHLSRLGQRIRWHGALSVDYLLPRHDHPSYIDCNPRLVEPVNALLAGHDLLTLLLHVSLDQEPPPMNVARAGVRSHAALQALLGCAMRTHSRQHLARECWRLLTKRGVYAGSQEELTPLRLDWPSAFPTVGAALWLAMRPRAAEGMARKGWGDHLLDPESVRTIRERIGADVP